MREVLRCLCRSEVNSHLGMQQPTGKRFSSQKATHHQLLPLPRTTIANAREQRATIITYFPVSERSVFEPPCQQPFPLFQTLPGTLPMIKHESLQRINGVSASILSWSRFNANIMEARRDFPRLSGGGSQIFPAAPRWEILEPVGEANSGLNVTQVLMLILIPCVCQGL